MVLRVLRQLLSTDLAIDLGTTNTLIYSAGKGIVCIEPSVVAVESLDGQKPRVVAVGIEAKNMLGKTPEKIVASRPIRGGVIADFELTGELLKKLIAKHRSSSDILRPKILISVPYGVSEVERRAVKESAEIAGAREVFLIEESMAGAIGASLPVTEPSASFILDIGGGTSEVAIISLGGIVYSQMARVGGDKMDESIINYVRRTYNLLIGEITAEQIKIAVGSALPTGDDLAIEITGRDVVHGAPQSVVISEDEIREVLMDSLSNITSMIRVALEKLPPELASDLVERGIVLSGGGSLIKGIDKFISDRINLPVYVAQNPISSVAMGAGIVLDNFDKLKGLIWQ